MPQLLRVEIEGPVARIVFARPQGLNVLSSALLYELDEAWTEVESANARVCILRGEGKTFMAGADIKEMARLDANSAREFSARGQRIFDRIEESKTVSIAAIHGACLGGGCELALACDIRMACAGVIIGQTEVSLGLVPGFGGTQRLPRVIGLGWALRMILSGEPLDETKALQCGLITDSGTAESLAERANALAKLILTRGPEAVRNSKKLTRYTSAEDQSNGIQAECFAFGHTFKSAEAYEGLAAFIEKRAPKF